MKIIKIVFINILLCVLIILAADFFLFFRISFQYSDVKLKNLPIFQKGRKYEDFCSRKYFVYIKPFFERIQRLSFRDAVNNNKNAVLIYGCSFAYGDRLSFAESFGAQLAEYTGRTVFNRALVSEGLKFALFQSQIFYILKNYYDKTAENNNYTYEECINSLDFDNETKSTFIKLFNNAVFQKKLKKYYKPVLKDKRVKNILYVFIYDHLRRMYVRILNPAEDVFSLVDYQNNNGRFTLKNNIFNGRYRILFMIDYFAETFRKTEAVQLEEGMQYLNEIKRLNLLSFGSDAEFTVLDYSLNKNAENVLRQHGLSFIKIEDLVKGNIKDSRYYAYDSEHPSALVWKEAVPELSKKLKLNEYQQKETDAELNAET